MTGILIDTYTWIEIFRNSPWGQQALECIEQNSPLAVSVLTLYELQYRFTDLCGEEKTGSFIATISTHADVIPVDMQIAIVAGTIRAGQKKGNGMGAVDCMILATARIHNLKVLTGDMHFKGLEETILL
ncbi:MAG: PIN domain-containing protein [Methanoregula sp.]|uniref:PIN domain-containing protein n=1 Tax=Methanoregula sp. TaxID=2052170 RepID=UPI003D0DA5AD